MFSIADLSSESWREIREEVSDLKAVFVTG